MPLPREVSQAFAVPEVAEVLGHCVIQGREIASPETLLVESARLLLVLSGDILPKPVQRLLMRSAQQQESQHREEGGLGQVDPAARSAKQQHRVSREVEVLSGEGFVGENKRLAAGPETE